MDVIAFVGATVPESILIAAGKLGVGGLPFGGPSLRRDQAGFHSGDVKIISNHPLKGLIMRSWVDQKIFGFGIGIVRPWRTGATPASKIDAASQPD
jgi:hypothetical protein